MLVDGLVLDGRDVLLLLDDEEGVAPLMEGPSSSLRVCRGILENGWVVIGQPRPDRDPLLSEFLESARPQGRGREEALEPPVEEKLARVRHGS